MTSKIQKDTMTLLYTSGFATTYVVVFLWVRIAGIIKVVAQADRYGGGWSGFPDITSH